MQKKDIYGLKYEELKGILIKNNFQKFRAEQIFKWLYEKNVSDFILMTDIAMNERVRLSEFFNISLDDKVVIYNSKKDSSSKFLIKFNDESVESVLMRERDRTTVCLSSHTGCALKCTFCATGKREGRNLSTGEIIRQFVYLAKESKERITNVVFMGMGEPLLNIDNVLSAIEILNCDKGIRIGARKITVSTAGIIPGIESLIEFPIQVKFALSLNSAIQKKREILMPIAKTYDLLSLKKVIRKYQNAKNKRITFEYILIPEVNNLDEDINAIFDYVKGIDCKINIIPYNPVDLKFRTPSKKEVNDFFLKLSSLKNAVTIRESRGRDIDGACGQLAGKQ